MTSTPEPAAAGVASATAPRPFRVIRVRHDTGDTTTLTFEAVGGGRLPPFAAGQFNMVYVFGVGEVPMSITGDSARPDVVVHTARGVGPVSSAIARLKRGDLVGLRGPFGRGWPVDEAAGGDLVMIAGGLGLAPLRPVLYQVLANRAAFGRVSLLYGAKTPDVLLYRKELERWRSDGTVRVDISVDQPAAGWTGRVGVAASLIPRLAIDPARTVAMICGPEVMMRFTVRELERSGLAQTAIYLSMERNMKCAVGFCGHCQLGPHFICRDGPVFRADRLMTALAVREL
ncbi:MAG TPA: FAD/NAD(P)-binding protein [Vicinamibacterales bacterium]|nr:FAD/NAD(P)-binding protein [Vicinamibacterales bacterium]